MPTEQDIDLLARGVLWGAFALSAVLGAIVHRTRYCTMGAIADVVTTGDGAGVYRAQVDPPAGAESALERLADAPDGVTDGVFIVARIRAAIDPDGDWEQQVRNAVDAYVAHIASRPAITLSWIREAPALGDAALPLNRLAMEHLTDMVVDLTSGSGFERAGIAPISRPVALILLGGLRELTALLVEDAPRFTHRGMHVDLARNFKHPATLRRLIDQTGADQVFMGARVTLRRSSSPGQCPARWRGRRSRRAGRTRRRSCGR